MNGRPPLALFDALDREFHFGLDVAATHMNRKCEMFFGPDHKYAHCRDGLNAKWAERGHKTCWMNPPYSRGLQGKFIAKAADERRKGVTTVALLPARTDTKAFHTHIYDINTWSARKGVEIRLLKGRLKFGGAQHGAPFPSMIVIFRG
jgi:site-specific DNA-methyltransferase (adenine-specific)